MTYTDSYAYVVLNDLDLAQKDLGSNLSSEGLNNTKKNTCIKLNVKHHRQKMTHKHIISILRIIKCTF